MQGCPSFKFLTMQMQPSASCARMWTVLSATIMFADKPHRLNERTSARRFCVLTILPPVSHSRLGYPRSGLSRSDFVRWHFSDQPGRSDDVRCSGETGSGWLCVKRRDGPILEVGICATTRLAVSNSDRPPLPDIDIIRRIGCLAGRYLGSRRRSRSRHA